MATRWQRFALVVADTSLRLGQRLHNRYTPAERRLPSRRERWDLAVCAFALHFDISGPSQRRMFANRVCSRPTWETYTHLLVSAGVLAQTGRRRTRWAPGWNRHRLRMALLHGAEVLALPYPTDQDPPALFDARWADTQATQRTWAAQSRRS